jgi:hypothetical protein
MNDPMRTAWNDAAPSDRCARERQVKAGGRWVHEACGRPALAWYTISHGDDRTSVPLCRPCIGEMAKDMISILTV